MSPILNCLIVAGADHSSVAAVSLGVPPSVVPPNIAEDATELPEILPTNPHPVAKLATSVHVEPSYDSVLTVAVVAALIPPKTKVDVVVPEAAV